MAESCSARAHRHWAALTADQRTAVGVIAGASAGVLACWNTPYVSRVLYPFKIVTVMAHEMGHALMVVLTGGRVVAIQVTADEGGLTTFVGGNPYLILPAGYIGSSLFGAFLLFCGFDRARLTIAAAALVELLLAAALYWTTNWFGRLYMLLFMAGIFATGYYGGGAWLVYLVLFMGVNSALYSVFDIIGDLINRRVEASDAYQLSLLYCHSTTLCPPELLGVFWLVFAALCMAAAVALGVTVFRVPPVPAPAPATGAAPPAYARLDESLELDEIFAER